MDSHGNVSAVRELSRFTPINQDNFEPLESLLGRVDDVADGMAVVMRRANTIGKLNDFIVKSFNVGNKKIEFVEPLVLTPTPTESRQFITLQNERFGIDVIAQTREELEDELYAELVMLWQQSQMPDEKLSQVFQIQKRNMVNASRETVHGNS
jgi:hypothetical protein